MVGCASLHLSALLPSGLPHSSSTSLYVAVLYGIRLTAYQLKAFLCISSKGLRIVSSWPGLGLLAISKLIMVAKTIDRFDWLGLGYVSKLGAKGESTAWTKIGEGMAP